MTVSNRVLIGKRILITGAFGALGRETALTASEAGASLGLLDAAHAPDHQQGAATAVVLSSVDLTNREAAERAVELVTRKLGGLDGLVNIAGAFQWSQVGSSTALVWDEMYAANLKTALHTTLAALPALRESRAGRIINIGANAALRAGDGMGPYAASKSAVHRLTESLAEELKSTNVNVNAILPSVIDTPANRKDMPKSDFSAWVPPRHVADLILYLLSDQSASIRGALIPIVGRL